MYVTCILHYAASIFFIDFQLALKRSNTLELEDVQEDVSDDIDMGENNIFLRHLVQLPGSYLQKIKRQKRPGGLPYGRDRDAHLKIWINALKKTKLGVAQAFFNP